MSPQHLPFANPYLIEQLQFMQDQENSHYQHDDYLRPWTAVTPSDRRTMCSWSYHIVDVCSVQREVACIGISYFDRFMCTSSRRARAALVSRREFQLAFITCLVITLKCRAGMQVNSDFVAETVCQSLYDQEDINEMEKEILCALQWRLNGPSPHEFISGLVELLPSHASSNSDLVSKLTIMSKIRAEMAMLDYSISLQSSSSIAYAALLIETQKMNADLFHPLDRLAWMKNIAKVMCMKANDVKAHITRGQMIEVAQRQLITSSAKNPRNDNISSTPERSDVSSMSMEKYNYCSPVSSKSSSMQSQEDCDELRLVAMSASSRDLSADNAMIDGCLDIQ